MGSKPQKQSSNISYPKKFPNKENNIPQNENQSSLTSKPDNIKSNNEINNETHSSIHSIKIKHQIENIHKNKISSVIELIDGRIATGSLDCSISIIQLEITSKKWKRNILIENAHYSSIDSLCELTNNRLISSSFDIKIWKFKLNEYNLITTIKHNINVNRVIIFSEKRFASCSFDGTVKIWSSIEPFVNEITFENESSTISIIKLKRQNTLVAGCYGKINFWDLPYKSKSYSLEGISIINHSHMIELTNGFIAAFSNNDNDCVLVVINPLKYEIVSRIVEEGITDKCSSLCVWDLESFIFMNENNFLQISSVNNKIIYNGQVNSSFEGYDGLISIQRGKYMLICNCSGGFVVIKPIFEN